MQNLQQQQQQQGSRLAAELDAKLGGNEPLTAAVAWYSDSYFNVLSLDERLNLYARDCTANENAALGLSLSLEDDESEAEISVARPCKCTRRHGDVCVCCATLKEARQRPLPPRGSRHDLIDDGWSYARAD
jgi:hypothetical protein